jgi:hypothetical protein
MISASIHLELLDGSPHGQRECNFEPGAVPRIVDILCLTGAPRYGNGRQEWKVVWVRWTPPSTPAPRVVVTNCSIGARLFDAATDCMDGTQPAAAEATFSAVANALGAPIPASGIVACQTASSAVR